MKYGTGSTRPAARRVRRFLAVAPLVLNGCAPDATPPAPIVRDSAGIEVVDNPQPVWTGETAWRIDPDPVLEIGVMDGRPEYLLSNVEAALMLADGRIAVADRGSSQVRFYDRTGRYVGSFGREGDGPGEFRYIRDLGRCGGDSLFVFDLQFDATVLTPTLEYARKVWPFNPVQPTRRPYALACAPNGHFAAIGWGRRDGPPPLGFHRAEAPAWVLAPAWLADGKAAVAEADGGPRPRAGAVDTFPGGLGVRAELGSFLSSERIGHRNGSGPHPFGRASSLAVDETGLYIGTGESGEVLRYSLNGELQRIVRWPAGDLGIRPEDLEVYRQEQLADVAAEDRPAVERTLREMPLPEAFPAYVRLELDPDGNLWIEGLRRPGTVQRRWTVIGRDGAWLGSVVSPTDLVITDIGRNEILGVARDGLGVERVRLVRLHRPATRWR